MKWIIALLLVVPLVLSFVPGLPTHGYHLVVLAILPLFFWKYPAQRARLGAYAGFLVLQALAYPDPDIGVLGWVLLLPWLWARERDDGAIWWKAAFLFGFLRSAAGFYWLGNIHWTAWFGVAVVSGFAFTVCYELLMRRATFLPYALRGATGWVLFEWVHSWIAGGFPWLYLGHTQHEFLPMIQIVAIFGVPGLSFVMAYAQHAVFRRERRPMVSAAAMIALALAYGGFRLSTEEPKATAQPVLLVQSTFPQSIKENKSENFRVIWRKLIDLTDEGLRRHPECGLVVWAETMFPVYHLEDNNRAFLRNAGELARRFERPAIYGVNSFRDNQDLRKFRGYNSAVLVKADGSFGGLYRKQWLVPMGEEFLPRRFFPEDWCDAMMDFLAARVGFPRSSDLRAGEGPATLDAGPGLRCAMSICFEGLGAGMTSESAQHEEPDLILNLVNNGWFGKTWEARQMAAIWKFRAVETGLPFLSCANAGVSCAFGPSGETIALLDKVTEAGVIAAPVPAAWDRPLYGRGGRWILPVLLPALALCFFLLERRKKRVPEPVSGNSGSA